MLKVSIIVPVYNAEKFVEQCINSLLEQTYKNIEIIAVNDGSTDNSLQVLSKFIMHKRVMILNQENSGAYLARKNGELKATGEYIMFVDADDWIERNTVEILVNKINEFNADIVKFREILEPKCDISPLIIKDTINPYIINNKNKTIIYDLFINTCILNKLSNEIIKRELIKYDKINKNLSQGEDALLNYEIFTNANTILMIPDVLYHYRNNPNSTTNSIELNKIIKNIEDIFYVYQRKLEYLKKWNYYNEKTEKEVAIGLVNFLCGELCKIYRIKAISNKRIEEVYNQIHLNEIFYFLSSKLEKKDIKDKNLLKRKIKINLIEKRYIKIYRYIIRIYYEIKERVKRK